MRGNDDPPLAVAVSVRDPDVAARACTAITASARGHVVVPHAADADVLITDAPEAALGAAILIVDGAAVEAARRQGLVSALPISFEPGQLIAAIEAAAQGLVSAPQAKALATPVPAALTPRERDVLELLITGAPNKAIARELEISVHTVKFHVAAIAAKLGARSRTDAVARALVLRSTMI